MTTNTTPTIGQLWPEQGGIYIGQRLIDGHAHHIIVAPGVESDIKNINFANVDSAVTAAGEINGHSDWRAPEQEDLMLAYVNAPEQFIRKGADSIYWSRSEHHDWPWAVAFETGDVYFDDRTHEFRVRPFRSFIASPIYPFCGRSPPAAWHSTQTPRFSKRPMRYASSSRSLWQACPETTRRISARTCAVIACAWFAESSQSL